MTLTELGKNAKATQIFLSQITTEDKNKALSAIADGLSSNKAAIIAANKIDLENGVANNMSQGLLDRLMLNAERIDGIAEGVRQVAALDDECGKVVYEYKKDNGLLIKKITVPIGIIGIIYEARPNVTADAAALCLKSGNAVILRGGKEAINSNKAIAEAMRNALEGVGFPKDVIQLVENTDRSSANEMMQLTEYLDCLIPRGGKGLIKAVVENSTVDRKSVV